MVEHVLQVLGQYLDHGARLREDQCLEAGADRQPRDAVGLRARGCSQAEIWIDHRRVPQQHVLVAGGRATLGDGVDLALDERLRMCLRVADGRRAQDELRVGAVEGAHALQPP